MPSRFIHVIPNDKIFYFFLKLDNIPLYVYTIHFINSFVDGYFSCFHICIILSYSARNTECGHLFWGLDFNLLDINPEVRLLDHMVVLFLIFWGTSMLFSTVTIPIYNHPNSMQGFAFLHILADTYLFVSIITILIDMKWHLLMVWICISLTISDVEFLFIYLLATCIFYLEIFRSCIHFLIGLFVLLPLSYRSF